MASRPAPKAAPARPARRGRHVDRFQLAGEVGDEQSSAGRHASAHLLDNAVMRVGIELKLHVGARVGSTGFAIAPARPLIFAPGVGDRLAAAVKLMLAHQAKPNRMAVVARIGSTLGVSISQSGVSRRGAWRRKSQDGQDLSRRNPPPSTIV